MSFFFNGRLFTLIPMDGSLWVGSYLKAIRLKWVVYGFLGLLSCAPLFSLSLKFSSFVSFKALVTHRVKTWKNCFNLCQLKSLSVQWLSYFSPSKLSIFQNVQKFQEITLNSRFWQHWKLRMPKRGPKEELKIGVQWLRCRQCYRDTRWKIMPVLEAVTATKTGRIFHLDPYI